MKLIFISVHTSNRPCYVYELMKEQQQQPSHLYFLYIFNFLFFLYIKKNLFNDKDLQVYGKNKNLKLILCSHKVITKKICHVGVFQWEKTYSMHRSECYEHTGTISKRKKWKSYNRVPYLGSILFILKYFAWQRGGIQR